jgi:chromosome segregation ATPase
MARQDGVTFEAVEQAANELRGAGVLPTVRLLREKVGGSNTTVLRHFTAWKAANPPARHQPREIPIEIVAAVESALARAEAAARAEIQAQLVEVQTTLDDVTRENEYLQDQAASLQAAKTALTTERDTLRGQLAEQVAEMQSLRESLAREQAAAEAARVGQAKAQLLVDGATSRISEQQEREREVRQELARLQDQAAAARDARAVSEQRAAVAEAQLAAERTERQASEARLELIQRDVQALTASVGKAAAAEATALELRSTVGMLQELLSRTQGWQTIAAPSGEAVPSLAGPGAAASPEKAPKRR